MLTFAGPIYITFNGLSLLHILGACKVLALRTLRFPFQQQRWDAGRRSGGLGRWGWKDVVVSAQEKFGWCV
eukprot:COSAG05_NODE_651_length_8095_cov_17.048572_7_plen_71_part_00